MNKNPKRFFLILLAGALCLGLAGCGGSFSSSDPADESASIEDSVETSGEEDIQEEQQDEDASEDSEEEQMSGIWDGSELPVVSGIIVGEETAGAAGEGQPVDTAGKVRITYTGNRSSVVYITSVDQLPDELDGEGYDEAYFEEHALILVTETVSSGSVDVGILSVAYSGDTALVTLYHEVPDGAMTTDDMATWLIWAEAEPDLDYQWLVENPALESDAVKY